MSNRLSHPALVASHARKLRRNADRLMIVYACAAAAFVLSIVLTSAGALGAIPTPKNQARILTSGIINVAVLPVDKKGFADLLKSAND